MDLKVISKDSKSIELSIEDEDISIPEIIQHNLLKNSQILFSGFAQKHPLLKNQVIRVQTKNKPPKSILVDSCSITIDEVQKLRSLLEKSLETRNE
jgi:DNA-directed RNA polymerase subunit L